MKRESRHRRPIIISAILLLLLIRVGAQPSEVTSVVVSPTADTGGPIFVNLTNWFIDTTLITEPIELNVTLELFVMVWDEVAVDLAIGCYKRSNETQWSNVSMTFVGHSQHDSDLYFFDANATECALSPSHPLEVWNIKFYAHDILDQWNVSDVINGSINALYDLNPTDTGPEPPDPVIIVVAAITVAVVIMVILVARRK